MYLSCQGAVEIETPIDQQMDLIITESEILTAKIYLGLSTSAGHQVSFQILPCLWLSVWQKGGFQTFMSPAEGHS